MSLTQKLGKKGRFAKVSIPNNSLIKVKSMKWTRPKLMRLMTPTSYGAACSGGPTPGTGCTGGAGDASGCGGGGGASGDSCNEGNSPAGACGGGNGATGYCGGGNGV